MKHSWTYLVLIIILLSCSKKTETHVLPLQLDTSRFEKTPDGHLTLSSALVVAAIRYKLIRESTKDVRSQLLNDNGLKIHNTTGTLFTTPKHPFSRLPGFTSFSLSDRRSYLAFSVDFMRDTCISVFFFDSTSNLRQVDACVNLISSVLGPYDVHRHYDTLRTVLNHYAKNLDQFTWLGKEYITYVRHAPAESTDFPTNSGFHYFYVVNMTDTSKYAPVSQALGVGQEGRGY